MLALYFQGYEITMQDLIPEEDKVSLLRPTAIRDELKWADNLLVPILKPTFTDGVFVAAQAACGV